MLKFDVLSFDFSRLFVHLKRIVLYIAIHAQCPFLSWRQSGCFFTTEACGTEFFISDIPGVYV